MAATESTMVPLGTPMPAFSLPEPATGKTIASAEVADGSRPVVVAFICNHCPFVKHLRSELAEFGRECREIGVAMVAISSNDAAAYPDDAPEKMALEARDAGYVFPYLYDETQAVARAFGAACTPDFFVYDRAGKLFYRGQFDDSRPGKGEPTGADLRAAVLAAVRGEPAPAVQKPSIGCNIKWRAAKG